MIVIVIPIAESMKEPEKFPKVLTGSMIFMTVLFTSVGLVSYLAFGDDVETVILLNLPAHSAVVDTIQLLYAMAICLSIPLQLFPAIRIMENGIFTLSGKNNLMVKWQKNLFRFGMVVACAIVAIGGSNVSYSKLYSIALAIWYTDRYCIAGSRQVRLDRRVSLLYTLGFLVPTSFPYESHRCQLAPKSWRYIPYRFRHGFHALYIRHHYFIVDFWWCS
jgi:hypothetical protein